MSDVAETLWYYGKDGEEAGPMKEGELLALLKSGQVYPDTLLWTESMVDWQPALELEPFRSALQDGLSIWTPEPRPWVRFWARRLDLFIYLLLAVAILYLAGEDFGIEESGFGFVAMVLWMIFLEACLLSVVGTTFGKWLFNITVSRENGEKPSFGVALKRTFFLWIRGLALDVAIINAVAWIFGWRNLKRDGESSWDRDAGTVVRHRKVEAFRWVAAALIFLTYFIMAMGVVAPWAREQVEMQLREEARKRQEQKA